MKATGIVRKVDKLGRFVLPSEVRKIQGIKEGTPMELFLDGTDIILKKYDPACVFCGESRGVVLFRDKLVCNKCVSDLIDG